MISSPEIVQVAAQLAAIIPISVPRTEIQEVMDPAIYELLAVVEAQGIGPVGPVFSHHARITPELFEFELGVPVSNPVEPTGRVRPGQLPAARVARTLYRGDYDGLAEAWGAFGAWLEAEGHAPASHLWERYLLGPESGPDPTTWCTELVRPLLD